MGRAILFVIGVVLVVGATTAVVWLATASSHQRERFDAWHFRRRR